MNHVAIKMLIGDRSKYLGLIFGVAFATLLITQQVSIFIGILARTSSAVYSVSEADIWVMDKRVRYIEEVEPLRDVELYNVRSVPGVKWAVPFYKGLATIRMRDGLTQQVQLMGIDSLSLVGICSKMLMGDPLSVKKPQGSIMDQNGFYFTWPGEELATGKEIELNDNKLTISAICDPMPTFLTFPILYLSYRKAMEITPPSRNKMSFVLVKADNEVDLQELKKNINAKTDLQVLTQEEFAWRSINYVLTRTGIPINFGITIMLGVIVGAAITAQTFYIFVMDNLKQLAAMKAIGVTNRQMFKILMTQAMMVGFSGYGIGIGYTALFFYLTADKPALKGFVLLWQVVAATGLLMSVIIIFSILFSLRKVFKLDPAIVFRG
jgi:putative ABC transport system permease protein